MDDEKLKKRIGGNIVMHRKRLGMTQAHLAMQLNYSDKAISKWERGESVPDVLTLVQMADFFEISVNDLVVDPNALPENTGGVMERAMERVAEKTLKRKADKKVILGLSSLLVWFVALLAFVVCSSLNLDRSWMAFFYAIPADAIVMLSLCSAWREYRWNQVLISGIVWGSLLSVYMTLLVFFSANVWKIFLLGIPGQIAVFLWFRLYRKTGKQNCE